FINPKAAARRPVVQSGNERANENELTEAKKDTADSNNSKQALRRQNKQQQNQQQRQKVLAEIQAMPPLPAPSKLVQPAKLFPQLAKQITAQQAVGAAVERFLQQPLSEEKRTVLVEGLGEQPIVLGEESSD